mmetsp:Transcript_24628/g.62761  ORF Transcript_24628/g.62761 Transcript_24628/m.62761 type:complete len:404 (+) Transcript_24628:69-1280(+)
MAMFPAHHAAAPLGQNSGRNFQMPGWLGCVGRHNSHICFNKDLKRSWWCAATSDATSSMTWPVVKECSLPASLGSRNALRMVSAMARSEACSSMGRPTQSPSIAARAACDMPSAWESSAASFLTPRGASPPAGLEEEEADWLCGRHIRLTPRFVASSDCEEPRSEAEARMAASCLKPSKMWAELAPDLALSSFQLEAPTPPPLPPPPPPLPATPPGEAPTPGSRLMLSFLTSCFSRPVAPARPRWPVHVGSEMWWLARSREDRCTAATALLAIKLAPCWMIFRSSKGCSTLSWLNVALMPFESYKVFKIELCSLLASLDPLCSLLVGKSEMDFMMSVVSVPPSSSSGLSFSKRALCFCLKACIAFGSKFGGIGGTSNRSAKSFHLKNCRCRGSLRIFCDKKCL